MPAENSPESMHCPRRPRRPIGSGNSAAMANLNLPNSPQRYPYLKRQSSLNLNQTKTTAGSGSVGSIQFGLGRHLGDDDLPRCSIRRRSRCCRYLRRCRFHLGLPVPVMPHGVLVFDQHAAVLSQLCRDLGALCHYSVELLKTWAGASDQSKPDEWLQPGSKPTSKYRIFRLANGWTLPGVRIGLPVSPRPLPEAATVA